MLIVVSPAKSLDYDSPLPTEEYSRPELLKQSRQLNKRLRDFSSFDLMELQKVSNRIAELNVERNHAWKTPFTPGNARQALFAFKGDVYIGLDAYSMTEANLEFAQEHLRILSGLYGVLRPLDLMQPYRLEMGTRLKTSDADNLYQFWGGQITQTLNKQLRTSGSQVLVNLASNEYFKSVKPKELNAEIITPVFKEHKNGAFKVLSFFAKKARGMMARYIIDNQIIDAEQLKDFDVEGYSFHPALSDGHTWTFTREQPAPR